MKVKDVGCILKLSPLGEYSLIVSWCTADHGIIRTAARNARKPGSDFAGRLDLFHECELLYAPSAKSDLASLASVELLSARLPLRSSLIRLQLASYMARLLLATVEPDAPGEEWHTLISKALDYVATAPPRKSILHHYEKRLAGLHGILSPAVPAYYALLQHFHHLPAGRGELMGTLP